MTVRNITKGTVLADTADKADTSQKRRTGLLKHQCLEPGQGLWIVPCEGVHTFGMKFTIDVVYLNRQRKIVKVRPQMRKGGISFCLRAHSVLELPAGRLAETNTTVGDQLELA